MQITVCNTTALINISTLKHVSVNKVDKKNASMMSFDKHMSI